MITKNGSNTERWKRSAQVARLAKGAMSRRTKKKRKENQRPRSKEAAAAAAAAAAGAKTLQSCPPLCNPIDSSPPGSPAPGILQARILEWVAMSYSNA